MATERARTHPTDPTEKAAARPDPDRSPVRLSRAVVGEVFSHAVECYPEECCGLGIGSTRGAPERVVRCTNVQDRQHSRGESTLDASRAFWIDERELYEATRAAEAEDRRIVLVYHSHVEADAYFSTSDLQGALGAAGAPLWPDAAQLVVSIYDGVVRDAAIYEWDPAARVYRGRRVEQGS